jgi:hypothetical protein
MTLILCIMTFIIGTQFKISANAEMVDFFRRSWALATEKAPLVKGFATEKIGEAVEAVATAKMGKLQKAVKTEFKKIDAEAKAKEGLIDGTPAA